VHQLGKGSNFNLRAIMLDTQGPEIRTGSFGNGVKEVDLVAGNLVTLTINDEFKTNQTKDVIWISYKDLVSSMKVGDTILFEDGNVELKVVEKHNEGDSLVCSVVNNCSVGNKRNVNLPGAIVTLPAISEKDKQDLRYVFSCAFLIVVCFCSIIIFYFIFLY
jgi:pyruvate kinase